MPFNYQALETLLKQPDYDSEELCIHIKKEVGTEIPISSMKRWSKGSDLGTINVEQIDALDQYARKRGYTNLEFYRPSPTSIRELKEENFHKPEGNLLTLQPLGYVYFPTRIGRRLQIIGEINTLADLCNLTPEDLKGRNFGEVSVKWIENFLEKQGLQLSKQ